MEKRFYTNSKILTVTIIFIIFIVNSHSQILHNVTALW